MKKVLFVLMILSLTTTGKAQNAKVDASGNYVALNTAADTDSAKATGKTFTDYKGEKSL